MAKKPQPGRHNCQKWQKLAKNGQKLPKMAQNRAKNWLKLAKNWPKNHSQAGAIGKNAKKWLKLAKLAQKMAKKWPKIRLFPPNLTGIYVGVLALKLGVFGPPGGSRGGSRGGPGGVPGGSRGGSRGGSPGGVPGVKKPPLMGSPPWAKSDFGPDFFNLQASSREKGSGIGVPRLSFSINRQNFQIKLVYLGDRVGYPLFCNFLA